MHNILQSLKLTLLNIGYARLDSAWDYDNVISPFSRLYLVTKGTATVYHNNRKFALRAGHLYLIPSFTYSRYQCDTYHEQYYIGFLEELGNGLSVYNLRSFIYELEAAEMDIHYFKNLLRLNPDRHLRNEDPKIYDNRPSLLKFEKKNESLSAQAYLETQALLQLLFSRFIQNADPTKMNPKNHFYDVLGHIGEHLHEDLNVANLAAFCHLSTDHFSRMFQQTFGIRPSNYLQTKRIERAQTLLLTTKNPIKEVASKTGWGTASYFTRIFKKTTGKTPGEFRRERLKV